MFSFRPVAWFPSARHGGGGARGDLRFRPAVCRAVADSRLLSNAQSSLPKSEQLHDYLYSVAGRSEKVTLK